MNSLQMNDRSSSMVRRLPSDCWSVVAIRTIRFLCLVVTAFLLSQVHQLLLDAVLDSHVEQLLNQRPCSVIENPERPEVLQLLCNS